MLYRFLKVLKTKKPAKKTTSTTTNHHRVLEKGLGEDPSMASMFRPFSVIFVFIFLVNAVNCIPSREFDSMLDSLRERGYDLFCNAIVTSDLQFEVLSYQNQNQRNEQEDEGRTTTNNNNATASLHTFTFFAPTDASLFALDMTQTASSYTDTLRFHVVPRRLSVAELRLLPDGYALPTLLSQRRLDIIRSTAYAAGVSVGGVEMAFPGLFYGRHVAVHGLSGILSIRSNAVSGISSVPPSPVPVVPPISSADRRWRSIPIFPENQTILAPSSRPMRPVPKSVSFNVTSRRRPPPPVESPAPGPKAESRHAPAPVPYAASRQAPATSPVNGRVDAPAPGPEADWMFHHPPANLDNAPVVTPAVSAPMFPDSEISLPPEGFSDAAVPAPVGLDLVAREKRGLSVMETSGGDMEGAMETMEISEALDGIRKCYVGIGLTDHDDHARIMQCNAS